MVGNISVGYSRKKGGGVAKKKKEEPSKQRKRRMCRGTKASKVENK